ncbi:hypothetical protein CFAM422_011472 [Trichoderma lentiforme]|uniref:Uncharacterized protein n=1 Tax=Trichoderma lentiforme TaxID=1567552 RepID=A0A9P4X4F9_9HYPO|nr:hypothetical protein CFAM422_011472 [Trichoderma lentiforme]
MEDADHKMYAPYVYRGDDGLLRDGQGSGARLLSEFTRDELLWLFRTDEEGLHRYRIHTIVDIPPYEPSVRDAAANCLPDISTYHWIDICNKSVPVYILPGKRWLLLRAVLHNYIYRRWFRSYRSEIDFMRFICKFVIPQDLPDDTTVSLSTVDTIISLNKAIIARFEAQRIGKVEKRAASQNLCSSSSWSDPVNLDPYILQPLFRALVIIVSDEKYNKEPSTALGDLPVCLARTGVEEELSAPILFEPLAAKVICHIEPGRVIQVTLETAIDFVIGLEAREAAAFGLRPDPATDWKPDEDMLEAWRSIGETEPLVGPNSQWVDDNAYPQWSGSGKYNEVSLMPRYEKTAFWMEGKREAREERYKEAERAAADAARASAAGSHD